MSHFSMSYLDVFFAQYFAFSYWQNFFFNQKFYRMCNFFNWKRDDSERKETHDSFKTALMLQFNSLHEIKVDELQSWRELSFALKIFSLSENLKKTKKINLERELWKNDKLEQS